MNDVDRYDFLFTFTGGLISMGAIALLGAPVWIMPAFTAVAILVAVYRHFYEPPRKRRTR